MPKIWDTVIYGGEPDLLECRLYELADTDIHRHVIVEADVTFQGRPKPYTYLEDKDRFAPWEDRIIYVPAKLGAGDAWGREHEQRENVFRGLTDARPDDVIIHADVDEIPLAAAIPAVSEVRVKSKFNARCAVFAVDWELPWTWTAPSVAPYSHISSFAAMRERDSYTNIAAPAWHLSWLGGPEAMLRKVNAFSHAEVIPWVTQGIHDGMYYERGLFWGTPHGAKGETQLIARDVDSGWPKWITERKCPEIWFRPR